MGVKGEGGQGEGEEGREGNEREWKGTGENTQFDKRDEKSGPEERR